MTDDIVPPTTRARQAILAHNEEEDQNSLIHLKGGRPTDDTQAKSAAERYEACRVIDEKSSRAMAACVGMIDAVSAVA
ncbi:hypothetical protein [Paraburkholderia bryophila]|uniref:hypothetical protein n=1 Tax=Paraburkholderia bryophila TaxID=420952 RepID=UPI000DCFD4EA|nr:hypothetical protein [Paraburkholderia bryophila]